MMGMLQSLFGHRWTGVISVLALLQVLIPAAGAQMCPNNVPHVDGVWKTLPYLMPINPISATLLANGKVLIVSGSEDNRYNSGGPDSYRYAVWDPSGSDQSSITLQAISYDVFCSGTAVLPDGRPLVVGGTQSYGFTGDNRASIFDPLTGQFPQSQDMADGRWYATATALGDGRISAFSGRISPGVTNNTVEIYDLANAGAGWSSPIGAPFTPPLYPRMELLPNGELFFTGNGDFSIGRGWLFNPADQTWVKAVATTTGRGYGTAVLLPLMPPSYPPKVMSFGGGNPATNSTEMIDLSQAPPVRTPGPSMSAGRIQMNAVLLPDGTVLTEGGSSQNFISDGPGRHGQIYRPGGNYFSSGGTASFSRLYHSTALLLPDATVMSMGSGPWGVGNYEPAIEVYTPPYLIDRNDQVITAKRPVITGVSNSLVGFGALFTASYTSSAPIASAVLVRPGSDTHAFDMGQRLVGLCGAAPQPVCGPQNGTLSLTTPPSGNIAPPGYYMLFLVDAAGVPSKAQFIQLSLHPQTPPPKAVITTPPMDVTIAAGGTVSFGSPSKSFEYSWVFPGGSPATSTLQNPGPVKFAAPGTYLVSLTAIDGFGNNDPNPPVRSITVTDTDADFSVTVHPASASVLPGNTVAFNVTVTPENGFTGSVKLAVGGQNEHYYGVTGATFSQPVINGGGSSTLYVSTASGASPYALPLGITGSSGAVSSTTTATVFVSMTVPTNLQASSDFGTVNLSWNGSRGAAGYHVKRALIAGGPYLSLGCTTSRAFADAGVVSGVNYYYVVAADYAGGTNGAQESADSQVASASPF